MPDPVIIFTGGHHTAALEVARELRDRHRATIIWFGHRHSMWKDRSDSAEYREVSTANFKFINLLAGKVYATYNPVRLARVPFGFVQAFLYLLFYRLKFGKRLKGVVTFGGYLGVPVSFCARLLGLQVIVHEQTAVAGWANKFIAIFAKKIALSWEKSLSHYPDKKTVFTGLPLRKEILEKIPVKHRNTKQIFITGGKQGSHAINSVVFAALTVLLPRYTVIHQTGSSSVFMDYQKAQEIKSHLPPDLARKYSIYDYLPPSGVAEMLANSGVVIGRSGAHTVYELAALGTPSVLIPLSWASHSEQLHNAKLLEAASQAVILEQSSLTPEALCRAIERVSNLSVSPLSVPLDGTNRLIDLISREFNI